MKCVERYSAASEKRAILCEDPDQLLTILRHDFADPTLDRPGAPIEVRYNWARQQRGSAWANLLQNPPVVVVEDENGEELRFTPFFSDSTARKPFNPYRKRHGPDYWAWVVYKWEQQP